MSPKVGETITVSNVQMIVPNVGNLVDLLVDGEQHVGRIISVSSDVTYVKLLSKDVKD